jgi:hypothetical protein
MRLPFYSTYRSNYDTVRLSDDAAVCIEVRIKGGPTMVQSEAGDVVNLADPLLVPLDALADYLNKPRLRRKAAVNE